jgi:hypothetical protein
MKSTAYLFAVLSLASACGNPKQEAIDEVQYGLTTASAIGRTSALAMDAIKGTASACVSVKTACTSYPCTNGEVTITLGAGCQLPLGGVASGTVTVTGSWQSADEATLSQTFTNAQVAAQSSTTKALAVAKVTQVSARRSGSTLTVRYTGANAVAGSSGSAVAVGAANTWDLSIDTKGTPDPNDDSMTVDATSAGAGFGSARTVRIRSALLSPECRQNPTAGSADITAVSGFIPTITNVQFHSACDGKAEVDGSTRDLQLLP